MRAFCLIILVSLVAIIIATTGTQNKEEHLLHAAAQSNLVELKKALQAGAIVNTIDSKSGNSALIWASYNGNVEIIHALLSAGADIEIRSKDGHKTALLMSVFKGHYQATEFLLSRAANIDATNDRGDSSLSIAAYVGHSDIVCLLLERGIDTLNDQSDIYGYSAVHFSSYKGHTDVTRQLVLAGANIDCLDHTGKTPMMLAAMEGHAETVRYLVANDANVNIQDNNGNSALMLSVFQHRSTRRSNLENIVECVETLLDANGLPDLRNSGGYTALMLATMNSYIEIVTILLNQDVDCSILNDEKESALSLSEKLGHDLITVMLKSRCSDINISLDDVRNKDVNGVEILSQEEVSIHDDL